MSDSDYQYEAVPTKYRGIWFDSRLEARWAAFLDGLEVDWSFHPFDLGGWFPDLVLKFPAVPYSNGSGETTLTTKREFLVEVKPFTEFHEPTAEQMRAAHQGAMILLGREPAANEDGNHLRIGWWVDDFLDEEHSEDSWQDVREIAGDEVIIGMCSACHQLSPCSAVHSYHCRRCGSNPGFTVEEPQGWQRLWAEALNITKYRPRS